MKKLYVLLTVAALISSGQNLSAQETLKSKIGQMLIVGALGTTMPDMRYPDMDTLKVDISERNLGGVLEFGYNLKNLQQMQLLSGNMKSLARTPVFIATDQEGGKVARLGSSNGFKATSTAYTMGTVIDNMDSTRLWASTMAGWLVEAGINVDFAPVTDVLVNPKSPAIAGVQRSFNKNPLKVAEHAGYFIEELHKKNLISALKHFPGHGSAATDSHLGFTDITNTWADSELVPYRELFSKGLVDIVMTGHLYNANIDTLPATLSEKTVQGLLRNQLGYQGVVITDDMSMGAISKYYGFFEAAAMAINAGVDILLYNRNILSDSTSLVRRLEDYLEKKVLDGTIPQSRIDESYARIMALKNRYFYPSGVGSITASLMPDKFELQGYPNPFNGTIKFQVKIPVSSHAEVRIYDMLGREVALVMDDYKSRGVYYLSWNAGDLSSGLYFAVLHSGDFTQASKLMLLK
ncbi:MAG: T9SS type A sorting domain-containing protein [Ignavibacteria bacterium]|jgi:beta-N-acetylhexosaminidase|nr:T9SS type A sorting domain-containing protein [Ignavibacteria bacterium]HEX2964055.1 glycoside hydrolase family 3 N-terminal domain-containing protein [Ignavibacteriales bacterium]MCU7499322.1 T9SS type A sorting domain-containing protein [Ignavibacteria bacterium]MCU7512551.1 T9SS type A sorting domain-containing protein [Ignavibacteria bacterium]MCU7519672.1 T9SS type A sorting domain-containing protein [Ignavibacteria bacterium]